MNQSVSAFQLKKLLASNSIHLIDIREHYLYERGTIASAINIPFRVLHDLPQNYLNKNDVYYIFCESGLMSERLVNYLNPMGYHLISVNDGYEAFEKL